MKNPLPTKKLGEVAYFQEGPGLRTFQFKPSGTRVINVANVQNGFLDLTETKFLDPKEIKEKYQHFLVNEGDILISTSGTIGRVARVGKEDIPLMLNTSVMRLRSLNENTLLLNQFLFYFLNSESFKKTLLSFKTGVAIFNVGPSHLKRIWIVLPSLLIQHQIVERLDAIQKAQELNDKQIALADELFQSLLDEELKPKKDWELKRLGEVCEKIKQIHPKKIFKKEFRYIDIESVDTKTNTIIETKRIEVDKAPSRARKLVIEGDTIFATTRPYLKNIAYIYKEFDNSICSTGFCVIRGMRDLVASNFLFFLSLSKPFISKVLIYQRGASYPAVSDSNIYNVKIHLPPFETQRQIVAKLQAAQDYKKKLLEQKQKLQELFNSCLDKAMKGELVS